MYDEWKPVRFTTDEEAAAAAEAAGDIELPESSSEEDEDEDEDADGGGGGGTVPVHHEPMPVLPIEVWLCIMRYVLIQYEYGLYVLCKHQLVYGLV